MCFSADDGEFPAALVKDAASLVEYVPLPAQAIFGG
jgi:hypothetical protein